MDLNSWRSKCKDECSRKVLLFPLIQLSKSFKFHPVSHNQSHNNQTNNHKYLFNITFQNLEFWDVTFLYFHVAIKRKDINKKKGNKRKISYANLMVGDDTT